MRGYIEANGEPVEVGDKKCCMGITCIVKEVCFSIYWGNGTDGGYDCEIIDTNGNYRSWKQRIDGGKLYKPSFVR